MTFFENPWLAGLFQFLGIGESAFGWNNNTWERGIFIDTKPLYAVALVGLLLVLK